MNDTVTNDFLLKAPPWVEYRTRIDLLEQDAAEPAVLAARKAMLGHPMIRRLIENCSGWPGHVLKRHNDATHLIHTLPFLADIGIEATDPGLPAILASVTGHRDDAGFFEIMMNVAPHFGGTGEDQWVWCLCDHPTVLSALLKMNADFPGKTGTIDALKSLGRDNGWPCVASSDLGKFKGPGRKEDPCPYANLISLKALGQIETERNSAACRNGVNTLFELWDRRKEKKPYLFGMGTDFKKLKAPLVWYDILHVLDTLSLFPDAVGDDRFGEMFDIVRQKADPDGRFTAESVWKAWSDWDFGQKKTPSPWITFLVQRIGKRAGMAL